MKVGDHFIFMRNPIIISLLLIIWAGILYYWGYHTYRKRYMASFSDKEPASCRKTDVKTEDNPEETATSTKTHYKLLPHFNQLIDENRIFLQNNLHIEKVARMLNTNRTYISRLINQEYQCSFSDFINRKRIEYAKELIRSHPEMTQEQLAEKAGFTHASSFSRTFKQHAGQTFREWYRHNQEKITLSGKR